MKNLLTRSIIIFGLLCFSSAPGCTGSKQAEKEATEKDPAEEAQSGQSANEADEETTEGVGEAANVENETAVEQAYEPETESASKDQGSEKPPPPECVRVTRCQVFQGTCTRLQPDESGKLASDEGELFWTEPGSEFVDESVTEGFWHVEVQLNCRRQPRLVAPDYECELQGDECVVN